MLPSRKPIQLVTVRTKEVASIGDKVWSHVGWGAGMGIADDPGVSPLRLDVTRETLPPRRKVGAPKAKPPPPHGMRDFLDYFNLVKMNIEMDLIDVKNTAINDLYIRGAGTLQELQDMPLGELDDLAWRQIPPQPKTPPPRPDERTIRNFLRVVISRAETEQLAVDEVWNTGVIELAKWTNKYEQEIQELGPARMAWLARWYLCEFPMGARIYLAAQDVRQLEVPMSRRAPQHDHHRAQAPLRVQGRDAPGAHAARAGQPGPGHGESGLSGGGGSRRQHFLGRRELGAQRDAATD